MASYNTISVMSLRYCNETRTQAIPAPLAPLTLILKSHDALAASAITSIDDAPMAGVLDIGAIVCTNRFNPDTSRHVVLGRGYQQREKGLPPRDAYAIVPLLPGRAAVREDAIVSVVLASALIPYPDWVVGERLYIDGAGVETELLIKGRRLREMVYDAKREEELKEAEEEKKKKAHLAVRFEYADDGTGGEEELPEIPKFHHDWEFLLWDWADWQTKEELEATFDVVVSMAVLPESDDEGEGEDEDDDDDTITVKSFSQ